MHSMEEFSDYSNISWLTQVPSNGSNCANFDISQSYIEEDLCKESNAVSLEETSDKKGCHVLYDQVVCEDILSDEEIDTL